MGREDRSLVSVEILRGVAALAVALWHLSWLGLGRSAPDAIPGWLACGYAGVDLFFVLSGFVLCHATDARPFHVGRYAARRFLRIVPLYALFTSLALLAALVHPAWDAGGRLTPDYALRSLLVVPMREAPYLGVGWSLEHELIFYALVGVLLGLGRGRWLPAALGALFAVGVGLHVVLPARGLRVGFDYHLFSLYQLEFLVGVLVFRARRRLAPLGAAVPLVAGACTFLLVAQAIAAHQLAVAPALEVPTQPMRGMGLLRVAGYGSAGGLLLAGMLEAERRGALAPRSALARRGIALLAGIGAASYALYLTHWFVYSILAKVYAAIGVRPQLAPLARAAALAAAVGVAWACHRTLERPLLRALRQRLGPALPAADSGATMAPAWSRTRPAR